jgi:arsenate reductase
MNDLKVNLKIYGIPNCDTIKKTKKFLEANNIDYDFIDFRKTPLNIKDIEKFITEIGLDLLVNRRSTTWKQLSNNEKDNIDATIILNNPTLMKRPIVIKDSFYFVGYDEKKLKE